MRVPVHEFCEQAASLVAAGQQFGWMGPSVGALEDRDALDPGSRPRPIARVRTDTLRQTNQERCHIPSRKENARRSAHYPNCLDTNSLVPR